MIRGRKHHFLVPSNYSPSEDRAPVLCHTVRADIQPEQTDCERVSRTGYMQGLSAQTEEIMMSNQTPEINDARDESPPPYTVSVKLTPVAVEVMRCLFLHGPTWDGNVPSKSGRDELFELKLATRINGYSWLTADGIRLALANKLDREKERWSRERGRRISQLEQIEAILELRLSKQAPGQEDCSVTGHSGRPTIEGLERLLKPENPNGRV